MFGKISRLAAILVFTLSLIAFSGCSSLQQTGKKVQHPIKIDGNAADWEGNLTYNEDKGLSTGFLHDDKYLYVALITAKPELINQVLMAGLTVWFDPSGGSDKVNGVRYPVGARMSGISREDLEKLRLKDPQERFNEMKKHSHQIQILKDGGSDKYVIEKDEDINIEAAIDLRNQAMVFELKVPLKKASKNTFDIINDDGKVTGVGFVTFDRNKIRGKSSSSPGSYGSLQGGTMSGAGGMGGYGGRSGGMGGYGREPGSMPEPLNLWIEVNLAE